jgi:hypothetical protein
MAKNGFTVTITQDLDLSKIKELKKKVGKAANRKARVGVPDNEKEKDGASIAKIAFAHEFGSPKRGIPERSFLRGALNSSKNQHELANLNEANLKRVLDGDMTIDTALGQMGLMAASQVQKYITNPEKPFKPLKPATIKRKKSTKPLIDTGNLRQSISWVLEGKSS